MLFGPCQKAKENIWRIRKMEKVIYSVTKVTKQENFKISGTGYITDTDLITTCMSKKNTPYIRVFEDCIKDCHLVDKTTDQFKGSYFVGFLQ